MFATLNEISYYGWEGVRSGMMISFLVVMFYFVIDQLFHFYHTPKYTIAVIIGVAVLGLVWGRYIVPPYQESFILPSEHWMNITRNLKWYCGGLAASLIPYFLLKYILLSRY